jgi:large subunit ribosomal protein L6
LYNYKLKMQKKNTIKIPKDILIIYSSSKKIITLVGPIKTRSLKLKLKLNIINSLNLIEVTLNPFIKTSNNAKKQIKAIQGTTVALLKQVMIEASSLIYKKLKLVGVGYRAFDVDEFKNDLLMFKLGYSHPLYFKIPFNLNIVCLKFTKLYIYGNSYQTVTQTASLIRSYKTPEPYKGKGILYEGEKIVLKEGKKV